MLTDTGETRVGAVVENVSLGLAMCAERVALFSTVATEAGTPVALALVSRRTSGSLTHPCGACLQVALELAGPDLRVLVADAEGNRAETTLGELLPKGPSKRPEAQWPPRRPDRHRPQRRARSGTSGTTGVASRPAAVGG